MKDDNIFFDKNDLKFCGQNVIIGKTVRIRRPDLVSIGDNTIIDDFTYISCALEIGSYCHIASNVTISGGANGKLTLKNMVGIGCGCSVHVASSDYLFASMDLPSVPEQYRFGGVCDDIFLESYVLLGSHTVVLPGVYLPEGFASGAHTVISQKKYEDWTLYRGLDCVKVFKRPNKKFFKNLNSDKLNLI